MEIDRSRVGMEKKLYELCAPVVETEGYLLYDFIYNPGSTLLQIFIMDQKTGSALIEDCIKVDRALSPLFEASDWIPESIVLEVSSPGVYRVLKSFDHFEKAIGKGIALVLNKKLSTEVQIGLPKKLNGQTKLKAKLMSVSKENITVMAEKYELKITFDEIKKANVEED